MSKQINPIKLTSELIRCESITPESAGSLDIIISYLGERETLRQNRFW